MKMTEYNEKWIREQARFRGIFDGETYKSQSFDRIIPVSAVPIYEESKKFVMQALDAGCDGTQISRLEDELAGFMGVKYAVALNSGEAALQMTLKIAAEKLYGKKSVNEGSLKGIKVFCQNLTRAEMVSPIVLEGGEPVFIDSSDEGCGWAMSPEVLEMAFERYPDVKLVIIDHIYGFPGEAGEIRRICFEHDALLIECIGEALGAEYRMPQTGGEKESWIKAGTLGDYCVADFGKDSMLGHTGGVVLTRDFYEAEKIRYWSEGARAATPWNQHEETGYQCGMSELDAAVLRGKLLHTPGITEKKKKIYERYCGGLDEGIVYMIPAGEDTRPAYRASCMLCESNIQFAETRNDRQYTYRDIQGTAAPMEIYDALHAFGAECETVYKPMNMQPVYRNFEYITPDGPWHMYENFRNDAFMLRCDISKSYYDRGIVLPSDINMTEEEQDRIIDIIYACFDKKELNRLAWVD